METVFSKLTSTPNLLNSEDYQTGYPPMQGLYHLCFRFIPKQKQFIETVFTNLLQTKSVK